MRNLIFNDGMLEVRVIGKMIHIVSRTYDEKYKRLDGDFVSFHANNWDKVKDYIDKCLNKEGEGDEK